VTSGRSSNNFTAYEASRVACRHRPARLHPTEQGPWPRCSCRRVPLRLHKVLPLPAEPGQPELE
jgi:hypothetical protein